MRFRPLMMTKCGKAKSLKLISGFPSFGLQRVLIDAEGNRKKILKFGERKYLQSDRVVLEPGSAADVAIVNEMYRRYLAGET